MKTIATRFCHLTGSSVTAMALMALVLALSGCSSTPPKPKPVHQRGWMGGQYKLAEKPGFFGTQGAVQSFPASLGRERTAAILVTALSSNAPARLAGVREGDLILEINHEPATNLKDFRRAVDRSEPGALLPVKIYRNGETLDYNVTVGRETFRYLGIFAMVLPPILRWPDLWPNPGFSLIALGYESKTERTELGSVEANYRRNCDPKGYHASDEDWNAWLVIFRISKEKTILSQESVPAKTASNHDAAPGAIP